MLARTPRFPCHRYVTRKENTFWLGSSQAPPKAVLPVIDYIYPDLNDKAFTVAPPNKVYGLEGTPQGE